MEGDLKDEQQKGVIPRAVEAIFEQLKQSKYTSSSVNASYLEIYNEELSDLLLVGDSGSGPPAATPRGFGNAGGSDGHMPKLQLVEQPPKKKEVRGTVAVQNLSDHKVESSADVLKLIARAQDKRKIGETQMNKKSSRSHCVFTLTVVSTRVTADGAGTMECTGKLHLVDLAGSECAKTAGGGETGKGLAGEARERERKNINQSLLTLGRVISTLKDCMEKKQDIASVRIPYRDSKLTRLLQESLGGRCKTVIIATLSPSVLAVDETFSTLNYAQQAHGIQNKPVATSYLKMTMNNGGIMKPGENGGEGSSGNTIQDWNEMECRLTYMQSQVEEAQSTLARKVREQEAIEKRAEAAEAARAKAEEELANEKAEVERLAAECAHQQAELQVAAFMISTREATETKLGKQARKLLGSLNATETEASTLHSTLTAAADAMDAQTARRGAFAASLESQLHAARDQVTSLGKALEKERSAMLSAAASAEAAISTHAGAMAKHAAAMATTHDEEAARAAKALDAVKESSTAALTSACTELAEGVSRAAQKAEKAQGEIANKIEGLVTAVQSAQAALSEGFDTAVGRQAAAEEEAAAQRGSIGAAVESYATDVGGRLAAERKRFVAHSGALRVLLAEIGEARGVESQAREAIDALISTEQGDSVADAQRMQSCIDAICDAAKEQKGKQPDSTLVQTLAAAAKALDDARAATTSALGAQQTGLDAAVDAQVSGNAMKETNKALLEARAGVEAAGDARVAEVEKAATALASQKAGLTAMLDEQSELRAQLLKQVMGSVEQTLNKQLATLAAKADKAIAAACAHADDVDQIGSSAAEATRAAVSTFVDRSDALTELSNQWGASNDDVVSRMKQAKEESAAVVVELDKGAKSVSAQHATAGENVQTWAAVDADCRDALAAAGKMQTTSIAEAAVATDGRVAALRSLDATAEKLEKMSDAASAQLTAAGADVDAGTEQLEEAHKAGDAAAGTIGEEIRTLSAASAASRKQEADAMNALNTAASTYASAATATLDEVMRAGNVSASEIETSAAAQSEAATELGATQTKAWETYSVGETKARDAAAGAVSKQGDLAAGESNLHTNAITVARENREASSTAAAAAHATVLDAHLTGVDGMRSAVETFTTDSSSEPTSVPARSPHPFVEQFAATPAEPAMRAHFDEHGATPMEPVEIEAIPESPTPSVRRTSLVQRALTASATKRASLVDGAALRNLTVAELRKLCDEYEVAKEGKKEELVKRLTDKGAKPPVSTPRSTPRRARSDPNVEAQTDAEAAVKKEAPAMLKQPSGIAKPGAMGKAPSLSKMPSGKLAKGQGVRGSANALKEVNAQ